MSLSNWPAGQPLRDYHRQRKIITAISNMNGIISLAPAASGRQ